MSKLTTNTRQHAQFQPLPPHTAAQVAEILRFIPPRPAYSDWIKVIAAVGSALPEADAVDVLGTWTPEDRPGEYRTKLHSRLRSVTIGTLILMAKQHGFDASAFTRRRAGAGRLTTGSTTPPQVQRSLAPAPLPPPPKKLPKYSKRLGTPEELATLARLRRLPSPRRPRRDASRRVPRVHR